MTCPTTLTILEDVRALLVDDTCWTKAEYARDDEGVSTYLTSDNARCWCLTGAVARVALRLLPDDHELSDYAIGLARLALDRAVDASGWGEGCGAIYFNDHHTTTYEDVMGVLDAAIEAVEKQDARS